MSEFRKRIIDPLLVPIAAFGVIGLLVFSFSRILLAIPEKGSTTIAFLIAAEIVGVAAVLAATIRLKAAQRIMLALMGLAIIGGGAASASLGVRPIEGHGETIAVVAKGIKFVPDTLHFPVESKVALALSNEDAGIQHNVAISKPGSADFLFNGELITGPTKTLYEIEPLAEGNYTFLCTVHPVQMVGQLTVGTEAPPVVPSPTLTPPPQARPTIAPSAPTPGAPTTADIVATDFDFDVDTVALAASAPVTVHVENDGAQLHNWSVYSQEGGGGTVVFKDDDYLTGGEERDYAFTSPAPGTYYFHCDVHPGLMKGTVRFI